MPARTTPSMHLSRLLRRGALALVPAMLLTLGGSLAQLSPATPGVAQSTSGPFAALDAAAHDYVLRARAPESYLDTGADGRPAVDPRDFITIVAIDERTLTDLGAYNGGYPRDYQAQLIERLL